MMNENKIKEIKEKYTGELLRKPNVVGVAIGFKETGGHKTDTLSLVVMVRKKVPSSQLRAGDIVPAEIEGILTDVRVVGDINAL